MKHINVNYSLNTREMDLQQYSLYFKLKNLIDKIVLIFNSTVIEAVDGNIDGLYPTVNRASLKRRALYKGESIRRAASDGAPAGLFLDP